MWYVLGLPSGSWDLCFSTYLWVTPCAVFLGAVALVDTVGPPGVMWTGHVTVWTKVSRSTLAVPEQTVTAAAGTLLWTLLLTRLPKVPCNTAIHCNTLQYNTLAVHKQTVTAAAGTLLCTLLLTRLPKVPCNTTYSSVSQVLSFFSSYIFILFTLFAHETLN